MTLTDKIEQLKQQFIITDAFGDNADDLMPLYWNIIDSVNKVDFKNKIKQLNQIKEQVYADDLFYSDADEIEQSKIFIMIDEIIKFIK